jgi:MoaA/NifB/PqqE/SkfB family radical SAM enzyme
MTGVPGVTETYDLSDDWNVDGYPGEDYQPRMREAEHIYELINDVVLCELRKQLKNNEKPDVCDRCFLVEDQGGVSFRMNYAIDHADLIQEDAIDDDGAIQDLSKITYLDLTLGNICNLQCKTCNPWSSHNWLKEVKELPHQDFEDNGVVERGTKHPWFVKAFTKRTKNGDYFFDPILPTVRTINFLGGEPLVVKEHDQWLKYIVERGWAGNKKLQYTTNGTTIPNRLIDVWSNFERVNLGISVDAIGDLASYVRYPTKWSLIEQNFDKLRHRCKEVKQIYVQMHTTVSSLNILSIGDVYDFAYKQYKAFHYWDDEKKRQHGYINILPHINIVDYPRFYHVRNMPDELKEQACEHIEATYNKYKGMIENDWEQSNLENLNNLKHSVMQERDPGEWKKFIDVQRASDKFRNIDGRNYIPWMRDYV